MDIHYVIDIEELDPKSLYTLDTSPERLVTELRTKVGSINDGIIYNYYSQLYMYILAHPEAAHYIADMIESDWDIMVPDEIWVPQGTNLVIIHLLAPGARIKVYREESEIPYVRRVCRSA